jgi:superfamily II DNA or RNA helicase
MLAIDECHHAKARTYERIIEHVGPKAWVIGLTATPERNDGKGLGDIFQTIVEGPDVGTLINAGYLSPYRLICPPQALDVSEVHMLGGDYNKAELEVVMDQGTIIGDAVDHYREHVHPRTCLVYCVSRKHARHVEQVYQSAGINARYVAGDTPKDERNAAIRGFRRGTPPVIVSVDLFGEGLDVPGLSAVQLLRPTQSLGLHLQQVGLCLRVEEGKKYAVILDHVGNTWRHGLPDDQRDWSLEVTSARKKKAEPAGPALSHCEQCFHVFRKGKPRCPICGFPVAVQTELPDEQDGKLKEIDPEEHRKLRKRKELTPEQRQRKRKEGMCTTLEDWVELAMERGHKPGWAGRRYMIRQGQRDLSPAKVAELKRDEAAIRQKLVMETA